MRIVNQTHDKPTKSRHKKLLADPDVNRWYQNIARGSIMTADVRIRRLGVYCERTDTTPQQIKTSRDENEKDANDEDLLEITKEEEDADIDFSAVEEL